MILGMAVVLLLGAAGVDKAQQVKLTFWTTEVEPKRMGIQQNLAGRFQQDTGIAVEVVPVEESKLPERVVAAAAANALPDVIFVPLDFVIAWVEEGILDPTAATAVINFLGADTFAAGPLNLAKVGDEWAAAPADGWGQLLLYRKDLFDEKGLAAPETWHAINAAAQALHNPPDMYGIEVGTDPTQVYMQQVFEHFALSNGCRLIVDGQVNLNTPECIVTLYFYKKLATQYTPPGDIYWKQTREDYHGGRAAMIIWSPFILDELAGLRDAVPVVPMDPPLHERTGIVTAFGGPFASAAAQWGQVSYFGITATAQAEAQQWVEFLLTDGYLDWLSMAPEGKFPLRPQFVDGWKNLEIGVDRKAKISDLYPDEVIDIIIQGVEKFDRWGFAAGFGACVGQVYGTKTLIQILRRYIDGDIATAQDAAQQMTNAIRQLAGCS